VKHDCLDSTVADLVSKKDDPNYEQVRGHVPKDLAMEFRLACTSHRLDYSQGIEAALRLLLSHLAEEKQVHVSSPDKE
jgi:hypothetical protein